MKTAYELFEAWDVDDTAFPATQVDAALPNAEVIGNDQYGYAGRVYDGDIVVGPFPTFAECEAALKVACSAAQPEADQETKHTPGPRTMQYRGDLGEYHSLAEGGDTIGVFGNRADAILDAAATDLLEACKAVAEWRDLVAQNYPEMLRPFDKAIAAIAKATS